MPSTKKTAEGSGPWWVENKAGDKFVWHVKADIESGDLTVVADESPYDRNGGFRAAEPKNPASIADLAEIINEGALQ